MQASETETFQGTLGRSLRGFEEAEGSYLPLLVRPTDSAALVLGTCIHTHLTLTQTLTPYKTSPLNKLS
jgi:hypothetical protein